MISGPRSICKKIANVVVFEYCWGNCWVCNVCYMIINFLHHGETISLDCIDTNSAFWCCKALPAGRAAVFDLGFGIHLVTQPSRGPRTLCTMLPLRYSSQPTFPRMRNAKDKMISVASMFMQACHIGRSSRASATMYLHECVYVSIKTNMRCRTNTFFVISSK